jgi:hypothetical protein
MLEQQTAKPDTVTRTRWSSGPLWTLSLFAVLWLIFFILYRRFPYLKNGSDVVFSAKLRWEASGPIFPADSHVLRVIIFGNSKVLAGFVPSLFDQLAAAANLKVSSFNSGFPGSDLVLPPLKTMCERGQAPNVLLLTLPWTGDPPRRSIFHFLPDDHDIVQWMFPFRNLARDFSSFVLHAPSRGGISAYYKEAEGDERIAIVQRGYYLITEQSNFPGGRLPDDFRLASDKPNTVSVRTAPARSSQVTELNQLVRQYHIRCYYVPEYLRIGEAAATTYDQPFATLVEQATSCKLLGPDYYLYPNRFFSDQTHLNRAGAEVYTEELFRLVENHLTAPGTTSFKPSFGLSGVVPGGPSTVVDSHSREKNLHRKLKPLN